MSQEIVKVTSKGQLTIPAKIRAESNLRQGSQIYMKSVGDFVIMKKVNDLSLDEISRVLQEVARDRGLSKLILEKNSGATRKKLWKKRYGQAKSYP